MSKGAATALTIATILLIACIVVTTALSIYRQLRPEPPRPINVCVIVSSREVSMIEGECPR